MLRRRGLPLGLAELHLDDVTTLVDLDDPATLRQLRLRSSRVATRQRKVTPRDARILYERRPAAIGIRWWSTFESLWINVTLFERALPRLRLASIRPLEAGDALVTDAARVLGP
jgi:hypothetical protein